ncbi:MAG: hypothetical protein N2C14_23805, partial [Planctomycetales bacterium]
EWLEGCYRRMLAKDQASRYPTMRTLIDELSAASGILEHNRLFPPLPVDELPAPSENIAPLPSGLAREQTVISQPEKTVAGGQPFAGPSKSALAPASRVPRAAWIGGAAVATGLLIGVVGWFVVTMFFPSHGAAERRAAVWVLEHGGTAIINGQHVGTPYNPPYGPVSVLDLSDCDAPIPDAILRDIGAIDPLEFLVLSDTSVTDKDLEYFYQLPHLEMLTLVDTQVSDEAVEKLKLRMPELRVFHSSPPPPSELPYLAPPRETKDE